MRQTDEVSSRYAVVVDNGQRVLRVDLKSGKSTVISDNDKSVAAGGKALFADLFGIAREGDGHYVVIARRGKGGPGDNPDPSRLIRIDPTTGAQSLIAGTPAMHYGLTSVAVNSFGGDIYFGDEDVPDPKYNASVVYRADPKSGKLSVVTGDTMSVKAGGVHTLGAPLGLSVDAYDGSLWVLADTAGDEHAPAEPSDYKGGILKVDVKTGKQSLVTTNYISTQHGGQALFRDPRAFVRTPEKDFYVVDDPAINDPKFTGDDARIIKVDAATGKATLVSDNATSKKAGGQALLHLPYGIAHEGNTLFVCDGDRLLTVDATTGAQAVLATGLGNAIGVLIEA